MRYAIAETFCSIQGEGSWTGTPMFFVRFAGCPVGRYRSTGDPPPVSEYMKTGADLRILIAENPQHSVCTTVNGMRFLCDTDYHKREELTPYEIFQRAENMTHMCLTGGEPFIHDLRSFMQSLPEDVKTVSIETSGTVVPTASVWDEVIYATKPTVWITCCPKAGFKEVWRSRVDEWKLLVDTKTTLGELVHFIGESTQPVYLQPINGVNTVHAANLKHCISLLMRKPEWQLSAQAHKYWGVK